MILLDTCALLWLDSDREKFSATATAVLHKQADALGVSPVTFMEIGIKMRRGRLNLPMPFEEWCEKVVQRYGIISLPVSRVVAVTAVGLPEIHNDPFDRIIIATAKINGIPVITADSMFKKYTEIRVSW
jgi:PIN domain nuclease of toxin-antitoxin system